jgi:hypothetical protein
MRTGLLYGSCAWVASLIVMPILAPLLFHGANMRAIGQLWVPLSLVVVGLPAFFIGFQQERRR